MEPPPSPTKRGRGDWNPGQGTGTPPLSKWQEIKLQYVGLLTNHKQPELAETFFNSVSCKILQRTYYHNDFMFVRPAVSTEYIERRMTPLNLYMDRGDEQQVRQAVREYGNAIKELASVNIFPGDMLFKNFGVTRGGRVVFYDYDEIAYMQDVSFRSIPQARTPEDEMSAEAGILWLPTTCFRKSSVLYVGR